MNNIDLLILTGAPGAGKSTVANALSGHLRELEVTHAVIELDDLAKIYPLTLQSFMYRNLAAIWPNYEALDEIKVIIPTYLQTGEFAIVREAAPASSLRVCELTVSRQELKRRIIDRERDEPRRQRLLEYIANYSRNSIEEEFVDFKVATSNFNAQQVAAEIVRILNWPT